jgi:hypothetical protein
MELVRTRILSGTCPECGTRLTGQERGEQTGESQPVEWVLVKQWCYNGCLSMSDGPVIPVQPAQGREAPPRRAVPTHVIVKPS